MNIVVDDLLRAMEAVKKMADPNPIVEVDVTCKVYDMLSRACRVRKDEISPLTASLFLSIPVNIVNNLSTGCRIHRKDGTTEDIKT